MARTGECQLTSENSTNPKVSSRPQALSATPPVSKGRGTGSLDSATATCVMTAVTLPIGTLTQKIDDTGRR